MPVLSPSADLNVGTSRLASVEDVAGPSLIVPRSALQATTLGVLSKQFILRSIRSLCTWRCALFHLSSLALFARMFDDRGATFLSTTSFVPHQGWKCCANCAISRQTLSGANLRQEEKPRRISEVQFAQHLAHQFVIHFSTHFRALSVHLRRLMGELVAISHVHLVWLPG